jgi:CheY-like chemotaxis protein
MSFAGYDITREYYVNEGFDDYVSKPIDRKELSRVLERFLKGHK